MLLYVTVMFKPLIPIISDALSHTFSETIHIETVHAILGSNHLEKELAASGTDNASGKNQNTLNSEEPVLVHVVADELKYNFYLSAVNIDYPFCKPYTLSSVFISKAGPPPKA